MLSEPMIPDLAATSSVVRKRRAPKHDFKDGNGKVFAHRHDNGGGWVADTAYAAPSVKITRNAQVYGFAKIYDSCQITGAAQVYGRARLYDGVQLRQNARVFDSAVLSDTAALEAGASAFGAAVIYGNSRLLHRVSVNGSATLCDVYVQGPVCRGFTVINNTAQINSTRIYGFCSISGHSRVFDSTLTHAFVNNAKLINAQINTHINWQHSHALNHHAGLDHFPNQTEPDVLVNIANSRIRFEGTAVDSHMAAPSNSVFVHDNVTLIGANLFFGGDSNAQEFFGNNRDDAIVFHSVECRSVYELEVALRNRLGPTRAPNIPQNYIPPTTGPTPENLEIVRQRRLMRLEREREE
jgi:hypothetical protein